MQKANYNSSIKKNVLWKLFEQFGSQGITFIVSTILARLVEPGSYGTIALVMSFVTILQVLTDCGFGNALIQKKDTDELDYSTILIFNSLACIGLYIGLFFLSPFISSYFNVQELNLLIKVLGLNLIISGFRNIPQAFLVKKMMFKNLFFSTMAGNVISSVIGIIMAVNNFGVWALVAQNLLSNLINTVVLWITMPLKLYVSFSFERLKTLFPYGSKILLSRLVDTMFEESRTFIIGKKYSTDALAFYNKGRQIPVFAANGIYTTAESILFPVMSNEQEDKESIKRMMSKSITILTYITSPMLIGFAICAKPIISIILTDKWIESAPFASIFSIALSLNPIIIANLNAIKAIGRSDIYLKIEIIRKIFSIGTLLISMNYGPKAIAISYLANYLAGVIINSYPNKRLLGYGLRDQIEDILPNVVLLFIMVIFVYPLSYLPVSNLALLIVQITTGIVVYIIGSVITKNKIFQMLVNEIKMHMR